MPLCAFSLLLEQVDNPVYPAFHPGNGGPGLRVVILVEFDTTADSQIVGLLQGIPNGGGINLACPSYKTLAGALTLLVGQQLLDLPARA